MAIPAIALATVAAVLAALPGDALFLALAAAIGAIPLGWRAYRERTAPGGRRVLGGAAAALGGLALALCAVRYALILLAIDRLESMIG